MPKYPLEVIKKKLSTDDFVKIRYGEWYNYIPLEEARKAHARNIKNCQNAINEHFNNKNVKILAVHGSSRSSLLSCAHEYSNSQMLLKKGLEATKEFNRIEVQEVNLRDYNIESCNSCYSTTSALCNWPCTCVWEEEEVLTKNGWKKLKTLNTNDYVLNGNGEFVKPLKYIEQGEKNVWKIETKQGFNIHLTPDHEVYLHKGKQSPHISKKSVNELEIGDKLLLRVPNEPSFSNNYNFNFSVEEMNNYFPKGFNYGEFKTRRKNGNLIEKKPGKYNKPNLPSKWSLELGEFLGYIMGDGNINYKNENTGAWWAVGCCSSLEDLDDAKKIFEYASKISGSKGSNCIRNRKTKINGITYNNNPCYYWYVYGMPIVEFLNKLGLTKKENIRERRLPNSLWQAPEEAIRGFLRGLFATDGTVKIDKRRVEVYGYKQVIVSLYSVSKPLLKDVQLLLFQYGIRSTINNPKTRNLFALNISSGFDVQIFKNKIGIANSRKQEILNLHETRRTFERPYAEVKSIVKIGIKKVVDLSMPKEHTFVARGFKISNCFPLDPMQELYPKVLWCNILFCSTGVNQSAMSSRLKAFCDRLISLDGGYFVEPEQFAFKDAAYREKMIATSLEQPVIYDQRMQNRVAGFFIASKDENDMGGTDDHGMPYLSYVRMVRESLYRGFHDFGFYFADPWYASFAANPYEEMSYDKQRLNEDNQAHEKAKQVVRASIKKAQDIMKNPPPARQHPVNRT